LEAVGRWCYRRRAVVGLWLVAVVGVGVLGATRGDALSRRAPMEGLFADVGHLPHVLTVVSP
jgi:hypothetical protein